MATWVSGRLHIFGVLLLAALRVGAAEANPPLDHAFDGAEAIRWSGDEDGFQSLREALDAIDETFPIPPELERRSRAGLAAQTPWTVKTIRRNSFPSDGGEKRWP